MITKEGTGVLLKSSINEDSMEILQVTAGTLTVEIGTVRQTGEPGDIFYVPSGLVLRVAANEGQGALRALVFKSEIISRNMEKVDKEFLYMFDVQSHIRIAKFTKDVPVYRSLSHCIDEAINEYRDKDVCFKLPIRANIYLLMTALMRYYCDLKNEDDAAVYHNVLRLRPVLDYMGVHYREKIYVEELSGMTGLSGDYFTKMFRDCLGKTPVDYINNMRINRSLIMLAETDLPLSQIAQSVGFNHLGYFHKIFKQYMDVPPNAYRESAKESGD